MTRSHLSTVSAYLVIYCLVGAYRTIAAQAPAPATPQAVGSTTGRFQLFAQPQGQVFMIDSATGRVWRYTHVTPSAGEVQKYLDSLIAAEVRLPLTEQERTAREASLRRKHASEIDSLATPCHGLVTCLVELDRVNLSNAGTFVSEIVK